MQMRDANDFEGFLVENGKTQEEAFEIVKLLFAFMISSNRHIEKDAEQGVQADIVRLT